MQEINFGTWIKPMPYIYLIFIFPFSFNRFAVLGTAFLMGAVLDAFSNTPGHHAAACTVLAFARIHTDTQLVDRDAVQLQGYHNIQPGFKGFTYFAVYTTLLTLLHHLVFFSFMYFKISAFFLIILVSLLSTLATFALMMLYRVIVKPR
ncbi:MAG: hypothetical protein JNL57_10255 [Bacteroidetes bacterium]|nr:hypothetical protein [Bacteroidota bacterium]